MKKSNLVYVLLFAGVSMHLGIGAILQGLTPPKDRYALMGNGKVSKKSFVNNGVVRVAPMARAKEVRFQYLSPQPTGAELDIAMFTPVRSTNKTYSTWFWPYEFEWVNGTTQALVVGKSPDQQEKSIIELWSFTESNGPSFKVLAMLPPSTETKLLWDLPTRKQVTKVFTGNLPNSGTMSFLIENKAFSTGTRYFFGLRGEKNVYELNTDNDTTTLIASPSAGNPGLHFAELSLELWHLASGAAHTSDGFIYTLSGKDILTSNKVHLIDADKNGTIDSVVKQTPSLGNYTGVDAPGIDTRF